MHYIMHTRHEQNNVNIVRMISTMLLEAALVQPPFSSDMSNEAPYLLRISKATPFVHPKPS